MSSQACPLCGLRYPAQSLLDLHIREDHAQRDKPAAPAAPAAAATPAAAPEAEAAPAAAAPADTPTPPPAPGPAPGTGRLSWAETARRALNRMIGKEPADPPHRAA
jgi:hypothetical protein